VNLRSNSETRAAHIIHSSIGAESIQTVALLKPLFIVPDLAGGGAERMTLTLIADLRRRGYDPILFMLRERGALLAEVPDGITVVAGVNGGANLHRSAIPIFLRLLRCARSADVIVGAMELEPTYFAFLCAKLLGKPAVGWVHIAMEQYLPRFSHWHRRLTEWIYPRLDRVVFCSKGAAASLDRVVRLRADRTTTILNFIDLESIRAKAREALPVWGRKAFAKPTLLASGRLTSQKGFDILIRAHARSRASGIDSNLIILGEGPLREELQKLAASLDVAASVFMPGFELNPYPAMKSASVFVLSSRLEGFSVVLLEALALGIPIVATDCPSGPAELLEGGRNGLLVPPDNEAALADAIATLLRDRQLCDSLKRAGLAHANEFTAEYAMPRWERLLSEVTDVRRKGASRDL
jgi:glycosyltransferase involved in cell wall biosynthesis